MNSSFDNKESQISLYQKQMKDNKENFTNQLNQDNSLNAQKAKASAKSLGNGNASVITDAKQSKGMAEGSEGIDVDSSHKSLFDQKYKHENKKN